MMRVPTDFIESGGSAKGSENGFKSFRQQLTELKMTAASKQATPQFYIATPSKPMPPLTEINLKTPRTSWDEFYRAKMYAEYVLGATNVFIIPNAGNSCQPATAIANPDIPIPQEWTSAGQPAFTY